MNDGDSSAAFILLVDTTRSALEPLVEPLERAGYPCATATSFREARALVAEATPDLLIAAIRLGSFNGLHLALQRHLDGKPTIVTDVVDDPVLRREAALLDTPYVSSAVHPEELLTIVRDSLSRRRADARRRWRRADLSQPVEATLDGLSVHVVDASYGGCRLRMSAPDATRLPTEVSLSIAAGSLIVRNRLVWRGPPISGTLGLALHERTASVIFAWRRWVDQIAA